MRALSSTTSDRTCIPPTKKRHLPSFVFVCVCVCVLRCCVLCLERVADAPSSSSPLFFSYSLIRGGSMRLILSFFSQCLSVFTAHRPRDRNVCTHGSPFIFSYFLFQYAMDRLGMLIRPSSAYLHPCVLPCGYKQMESRKIRRIR
jgi:hypothetical protein